MADIKPIYGDDETERFCKRFANALERRNLLNSVIDDCYRYAMPLLDRKEEAYRALARNLAPGDLAPMPGLPELLD